MSATTDLTPDEIADRILVLGGRGPVLDLGTGATSVSRSLRRKGARPGEVARDGAGEATEPAVSLVTLLDPPDALTPELLDRATATGERVLVLPPRGCAPEDRVRLAAELAARSFHRQHDAAVVEVATAAMLFARETAVPADLAERYERLVADVLLRCDAEREDMEDEVVAARQALLVNRDHVVGTEAEVGRANREVVRLTHELADTRKRVRALTRRRAELTARVETLRARLATAQQRQVTLSRRLRELEAQTAGGSSTARRLARRLVGRLR